MASAEPQDRRILLGEITGAHGIRGEVIIRSYTEAPEDIAAYGPLGSEANDRSFTITVRRAMPKGVVAAIAGLSDRTAAEKLKGTRLYVPRSALPATADSEYFHADLIGLDAIDATGAEIGHVIAVHNFGAGDILEIRKAGAKETLLIPFTDAAVPRVDVAAGQVVVALPEEVLASEEIDDSGAEPSDDQR